MLFFAGLDLVWARTLAFPDATTANGQLFRYFASILPLRVWAILWALVGIACLVDAFLPRDRWGYEASILVYLLWSGLGFVGVWFANVAPTTPTAFLVLAGLVWRLSKLGDTSAPEPSSERPSSSENEG